MIPVFDAYADLHPVMAKPKQRKRLSDFLVNAICSQYKQSVSLIITGQKGMGKSYAGLSIADSCSQRLVERLGGSPTDYFDPEIDMAVISTEEVERVSCIQRQHGIKVYDDVSIGWSARDWRSTGNTMKNDIFTIDRISEGISIFTLPQNFMLDKIPRSLAGYYCEMEHRYFSRGFSTMKFFKTVFMGRANELTYRHITDGSSKFVIYVIPKPPDDLCNWYDARRKKITYQEVDKRRSVQDSGGHAKNPVPSPKFLKMQARIGQYKDQIAGLPMAQKVKALASLGVPRETAYYWKNQGYLV